MKVTVDEKPKPNQKFPMLMKSANGIIILATGKNKFDYLHGTVVSTVNNIYDIGEYREDWGASCFEPLPVGSQIILEND